MAIEQLISSCSTAGCRFMSQLKGVYFALKGKKKRVSSSSLATKLQDGTRTMQSYQDQSRAVPTEYKGGPIEL